MVFHLANELGPKQRSHLEGHSVEVGKLFYRGGKGFCDVKYFYLLTEAQFCGIFW